MTVKYLEKIDHIIFGVHDLEKGIQHFAELIGIEARIAGRHPMFGTWNALFRLGDNGFFEIIAPDPKKDSTINPTIFGLETLKEPKLIGWMVKEHDILNKIQKLNKLLVITGSLISGKREKPNGEILTWKLTDPLVSVEKGAIPFLIDWEESEHPSQSMEHICSLLEFTVFHPHPTKIQRIFDALELDNPVIRSDEISFLAKINTPNGIIEIR